MFWERNMKWIFPAMLVLGLAAGIYLLAGSVSGENYPYRKPGLWEVTNQSFSSPEMEKIAKGLITGTKMCIDRDTDQLLLQAGQAIAKQLCSKTGMKIDGKTIIVETDCTVLGMHTTGKSVTTIREASFHTETESHADGQPNPTRTSQDGRWAGACPSDLKPGDVVMMNGALKLNIKDLGNKASQLLR
jgi:hypothetical protein